MANELNTEGKDLINDEFMKGFGIESTSMLDSADLNAFLDSDETVLGNPDGVTPANDDDDTPPPPARKNTPSKNNDTPDDTGKSKDQLALEKKQQLEKEQQEKEKALSQFLTDDDDTAEPAAGKTTPAKGADTKTDDEPDEAIAENLAVMSKEFYRLGLFSKDKDEEDEEIRDPNAFLAKVEESFKKGTRQTLESYLSHFSPKNRELFFATYEKGVDPAAYLLQLNKIESYEKMDLKVEANQELVVTQALRNQGWEEEDIKDQIAKLKSYSELEDTSAKYQKGLVKAEKANAKKLEEDAQVEQERLAQLDEEYDNNLRSVYTDKLKEKDFDGLPVTDKTVARAYDFAYNKKWELNGALLTDFDRFILDLKRPENHALKAKLALLISQDYDPSKPLKVDFSKIQKKAVSTENKALFKDLASKSKGSTRSTANSGVAKSFFD